MTVTDELSILGLAGKVALVTGGGAGIGRATAELYARLGMKVVVAEIDGGRAEAARGALAALGANHRIFEADVRDGDAVGHMMNEIDGAYGRLDVLVNNVGDYLGYKKSFESSTEQEWDDLYRINLL